MSVLSGDPENREALELKTQAEACAKSTPTGASPSTSCEGTSGRRRSGPGCGRTGAGLSTAHEGHARALR